LERRLDSYLDAYWPNPATEGQPKFFCEDDETNYRLAPTPDSAYAYGAYFTRLPTGLTVSNANTEVGDNYEDMLLKACMWETCKFLQFWEAALFWKEEYITEAAKIDPEIKKMYQNEAGVR